MSDFSRASLATAACVDPWALSDQLEAGDPTSVRGMGAQFREASALAAEAASWGRKADDTMAAVYLNDGQSVFDAPASTAEGQTLLAENGDLMEEVARILVAVGDELEAAKAEARKQILALSADINETIERRNSYMSDNAAALTPATAEAADQRFFLEAVARVATRGRAVKEQVDSYNALLANRIGHMNQFGYEARAPIPETQWTDEVVRFGGDVLEGLSNAAEDTVQSLAELNPLRLLEDPSSWVEDVTRYAAGVGQLGQGLVSDPLGTLDEVFTGGAIGRGQPGVAVGEFAGGILAGGIAGKLTKLGKLDALTDPADDNRREDDDDDSPGSAARRRSDADQYSARISEGHAFLRHVILRGEFPGIRTRAEFAEMVENVVLHGESKPILRGRTGYWLDGVVVVISPTDTDGGTAFVPREGRAYFDRRLK